MQSVYPVRKSTADRAVYTTKTDLLLFLNFLDTNPIIQKFLKHDSSFRLADKYLIAMVFIYFKRARLSPEDYTYLNFFAGLCLAHSMEEDADLSSEIYPWALGEGFRHELARLLELKTLLWVAMDHRAAVSRHCCKQLILVSETHPVWRRERTTQQVTELLSGEYASEFRRPATSPRELDGKGRKHLKKLFQRQK